MLSFPVTLEACGSYNKLLNKMMQARYLCHVIIDGNF